jgi:hypothetical protein
LIPPSALDRQTHAHLEIGIILIDVETLNQVIHRIGRIEVVPGKLHDPGGIVPTAQIGRRRENIGRLSIGVTGDGHADRPQDGDEDAQGYRDRHGRHREGHQVHACTAGQESKRRHGIIENREIQLAAGGIRRCATGIGGIATQAAEVKIVRQVADEVRRFAADIVDRTGDFIRTEGGQIHRRQTETAQGGAGAGIKSIQVEAAQ